ncbi:GSCFA domain-containing protein [Lutimonas halocynthiae]|uniref:GSCFA domain-containing protein n=1 Tax=Lutimonas halocynthiae TaxID=1446477 RepID=UPI0025B4DD5A|nr:GSCFA domain-containing protein [Lutimonas halocynthiae]MDN3641864.1 GSCFA domain-containing protein [Lutimonas halocynthiae]
MKFRTEIKCRPASQQIDHKSKVVLLGSCFSEHMESKFDHFKFDSFSNPYGILFHPLAIKKAVQDCIAENYYAQDSLLKHNDSWLSLNHHSKFNHSSPEKTLIAINQQIEEAHTALKKASHVIITLGTAWVYTYNENGQTVGNCHKISQKKFTKSLLTSEEILASLKGIIKDVRSVNKDVNFIFTLSPVRHLKDGFIENSLSKALLLAAIHALQREPSVFYFPAYEIMMDDLRDYRFYNSDMIHPNETAVDYIWDLFGNSWISESSRKLMAEIDEIQRSLAHRPFDSASEGHKKFLITLEEKIDQLHLRHPQIKFHKKRK